MTTTPSPKAASVSQGVPGFQCRVHDWIVACFGEEIGSDRIERNHRFIEEALELVQANGCTRSEAHQLVDYVFDRPAGEPHQEVGGVMNTLAALCTASGIDMAEAGETELARVWTKVEQIRAKQAAKPKHSPLPQHVSASSEAPSLDAAVPASGGVEAVATVIYDAMGYDRSGAVVDIDGIPHGSWKVACDAAIEIIASLSPAPTSGSEAAVGADRWPLKNEALATSPADEAKS